MDGEMHSALYPQFWKFECLSKISLFCWLASEDRNATDTYVLCYKHLETANHLLLS